ncbi:MAG TPA: VCBS repeat-containing protein, partial [Candidatus Eisenbacteria bacterium]|nr:VCBS repeat-containing protein [Candidatus Eisenbacteria bacterium]
MPRRRRTLVLALGLVAATAVAGAVVIAAPRFLGSQTPTTALAAPHYFDEATGAGLDHTYDGGFEFAVGGGLAVLDCDKDGKPDVYIAGGSNPAALFRNDSPVGGALRFSAVHDPATDLADVNGAYPIDIDSDGHADLVVLRSGESELLRGLGGCRFEPANERWSFDAGRSWASAFSATWDGTAALPTLAIGTYLSLEEAPDGSRSCTDNAVVRPNGEGTGYAAPVALTPGYCTLSMLFSDWDRSGRRDLR